MPGIENLSCRQGPLQETSVCQQRRALLRWQFQLRNVICTLAAGSIPAAWFTGSTRLMDHLAFLSLALNNLSGVVPPGAAEAVSQQAGGIVLAPMNKGFGLCGALPEGGNFVYLDPKDDSLHNLTGVLHSGHCRGE